MDQKTLNMDYPIEILENRDEWQHTFQTVWLDHYQKTGEVKWDLYNRPNNKTAPAGPGIDLSTSRLMFITTAGAYLEDGQEPFDAADDLGDYTIRRFPLSTALDALAVTHGHYDHTAVNEDPQVLLPLRHLEAMVAEGVIGELAPSVVSFMGYQPVATRVVDETIPPIVQIAKEENARAALLVPAWPICSQSVGLIARALEMEGVATTLTSWNAGRTRVTAPPRATFTKLNRGATLGKPHDHQQQRRILTATLDLLAQDAPIEPVYLDESAE